MRWLARIGVALLVIAAASYAGDLAVFKLHGSPTATVTVSQFISAPLKNNKEEIDYLGSQDVACSVTLFPQLGYEPCWYLRRHRNQTNTL